MAFAGLALAGVPAPGHHYGLAVSPAIAVTKPGHTVVFTATDTGRTRLPLTVTATSVVRHGGRCVISRQPVSWAHVSPPTMFTLKPGGHRRIRVTVAASGPAGAQDLAVNVSTPVGQRGTVGVVGDVTAQAAVTFHGPQATPPCLKVDLPSSHRWALAGLVVVPVAPVGW